MKKFTPKRAFAIAEKEVFHIFRDPFTLIAALGLPIFMVLIFGVSIEFNVKNIPLSVSDAKPSQSSRRVLDVFGSSGYFIIQKTHPPTKPLTDSPAKVLELL